MTLNFCRGVISDDELLFSSDEEILEGLSSQGVVNVRRIFTRKGTDTIPTKHVILTFSSSVLLSIIKAGYMNIRMRPYIPHPLRCFKFQKLNLAILKLLVVGSKFVPDVLILAVSLSPSVQTATKLMNLLPNLVPSGYKRRKFKKSELSKS
ncbi:hypothetical protein AVEN_87589-1 [Araneus ventricosus]|uniref:Uncharacterized protein n=1 Tax=Araneus ventricosus TaxID=182803 RepID=A0A4Y2LSX8_ARAVE|nr:hypothetical protein AVEN_87589-1 [Araneus ventricosus]